MKKYALFTALLFIFSIKLLEAQVRSGDLNTHRLFSLPDGICYAGKGIKRIYIPPPPAFEKFVRSGGKGGGNISVYYSGFTPQAEVAFAYAAGIISSILPGPSKITIRTSWKKNQNQNILGQSSISGFRQGWEIDAIEPDLYYPLSLAEKIAGRKLNADEEGDFFIEINSSVNWYLGTDGQTPADKYDLVTVVLHEICHGLGFYSGMLVSNSKGYCAGLVYDKFLENRSGQKLVDSFDFPSGSAQLYEQLTGKSLYFDGPLTRAYSGKRHKIWAPVSWDAGSSISHLDEDSTLSDRALMTPYIRKSEAIHDPGKFTFSILGDLGWINSRVLHTPPGDTEENLSMIPVDVNISSDTLYNKDGVGVVYSFDNFVTNDTIFMTGSGDDKYRAFIDVPSYNSGLKYYFFVTDCFSRVYRSPSRARDSCYSAYVGTDTIKPVISHIPATYCLQTDRSIPVNASVHDNTGIDSVFIRYGTSSGSSGSLTLARSGKSDFSGSLDLAMNGINGGDTIFYSIVAVDSALNANIAVLPEAGNYAVSVEKIGSVTGSYATDFSDASPDFFMQGFEIARPAGFSGYGLHSRHPYESPESDGGSIDCTAMLRHPVTLSSSGLLISYREVVLVEPGETGSVFGSDGFYDYVIIEASGNYGKTWTNLLDGYSSAYSPLWKQAYDSAITVVNLIPNSVYTGRESMLHDHLVYFMPDESLKEGDTLLIRFRLFSDPYAHGWGWAVDDLKINPLIDDVEEAVSEGPQIFPNPGRGLLRITVPGGSFTYSIAASSGKYLVRNRLSDGNEAYADISSYPSGLYAIIIQYGGRTRVEKYILVK